MKEGKIEAANRVIEQMVRTGGNSPELHILLSQAHYERGDVAKAPEELQTAISLDRKVRLAHFYAGLILLKAGSLEKAAREFESELALNANDVQAKYHLGFVLLAQQKTSQGMTLMRDVVRERLTADARTNGSFVTDRRHQEQCGKSREATKLKPDQPTFINNSAAYMAAGRKAEVRTNSKSPDN